MAQNWARNPLQSRVILMSSECLKNRQKQNYVICGSQIGMYVHEILFMSESTPPKNTNLFFTPEIRLPVSKII